jgi:hypothetical protein
MRRLGRSELKTQLNESVGKRLRGLPMIVGGIRLLLKRIILLIVPRPEPATYGPLGKPGKALALNSEKKEKLRRAFGAQGE